MKVTLLGTGTSCGVPVLGCRCRVCTSNDPKDKRLRCSALIETKSTRILIDCGPDFRQQMLNREFRKIDALLVTHMHYDHVGGIDDIRPFCHFGEIRIMGDDLSVATIRRNLPYCFGDKKYPGSPNISLETIVPHQELLIGDIPITPFFVMHGRLPILAFRIKNFAYITDMKTIDQSELYYLKGVTTLVVNALRINKEHDSHQTLEDAIIFAQAIGAKHTFFIHCCHDIGLQEETNAILPKGMKLAYDGQIISIKD